MQLLSKPCIHCVQIQRQQHGTETGTCSSRCNGLKLLPPLAGGAMTQAGAVYSSPLLQVHAMHVLQSPPQHAMVKWESLTV